MCVHEPTITYVTVNLVRLACTQKPSVSDFYVRACNQCAHTNLAIVCTFQKSVSELQVFKRGPLWRGNDPHYPHHRHHCLHHRLYNYTFLHHGCNYAHCLASLATPGRPCTPQEGRWCSGWTDGLRPATTQSQRR